MLKQQVYEQELAKLNEIFKDIEESKKKLVEGLIQDAAFLYAENWELKEKIKTVGMVKFHPTNSAMQKETKAANQVLKNMNTYATIIKALSSAFVKVDDDDDDMGDYE